MPLYLFSIDLEDVRLLIPGGERYRERVPAMTERYLEFLRAHKVRATFFVVGQTARQYPTLIRAIAAEGHELGCHTDRHTPLDRLDPASFRDDLELNIDSLITAGAPRPIGFRAPVMSLTRSADWAYAVLADLGFTYSSSVLPANNPLYGWPEFGAAPRHVNGVLEVPVTPLATPGVRVPFAGGVYFRVLPWSLIRAGFRRALAADRHVVGYFHPYDLDTDQERFMHPGINNSRFYNALMYAGRGRVLPRLERIMSMGWTIRPYRDALATLAA